MNLHIITYSSATQEWNPPDIWRKESSILGVIVMYGEAEIYDDDSIFQLKDCSAMFIKTSRTTTIRLKSATAVVWKPSPRDISEIPYNTKIILDETSATVIHDVFFENKRSAAHRASALDLICHQLQNTHGNGIRVQLYLPLTARDTQETIVKLIAEHIRSHLDEPITLDKLAKRFRCSKQDIIKSFQEEKGESPSQTLTRLRLKHSQELLQNSDRTISQIAYAVGYKDLAGFSHFFKKQTGLSPSDFRNNCHWLV